MNMRTYTNITYEKNRDIIQLMHILSNPSTSIEVYRNTFYKLGKALGALLDEKKHSRYGNTMLACASEDADWLAQGVLSSISQKNVALAVFWNQRITLDETTKLEYSPIVKSYIEPIEECQTLIVVKSIIRSTFLVKTQLNR